MTENTNSNNEFESKTSKVQILIVDDEQDLLDIISDTLTSRGISCTTAISGEEAISAYRKTNPQLIISDCNMPGLNGIELFRFLRDLGNRAPVIWLTGNSSPQTLREAWLRGVLSIFQKPFEVTDLVQHCQQYLKMTPEEVVELRPKFLADKIFKNVSVDIDMALYEKLKNKCIASSTSISRYISELIDLDLK